MVLKIFLGAVGLGLGFIVGFIACIVLGIMPFTIEC